MSRIERDALGRLRLPDRAYYGVQTARAITNFPVSGMRAHPDLVRAYALVKKAAALVNMELEQLDTRRGRAIVRAADEVLAGKLADQFPVDVFQAGAGTSFNMNVNEVLANRALELLGRRKGDYSYLSPNDHVNMAQSSNDTFPSASHIAVIFGADRLSGILRELARVFGRKAGEFGTIIKSGRTHLMDALPLTLGNEFTAYALAIERARERIGQRRDDLSELAIGGTAVGTGVNAHPKYRALVISKLSKLAGVGFRPARDSFEALQSRSLLAAFSSALKELALELIRIANDLRLLGSGPTTGLAEIELPAVQPGSSIMPGKVNPSLPECLDMIGFQVVGNDLCVALAAQAGQMELNVMVPVMTHNVLQALALLNNFLPVFGAKCIAGIKADKKRCRAYLDRNPSLATFLSRKLGYLKAAELAKEALAKGVSVLELAQSRNLISAAEVREIVNPGRRARRR